MWLWALEPCSWGCNQPFISVLGHLTHLHSASSSITCFGQNIFLGGYQGCAWRVLWVTSLLFSALSWPRQCWINADAASCVSWVSLSLRPLLQLLLDSDKVSLRVTSGSSCTTQVLFDRNVTYLLPSSFWKTIQFSSLPKALRFLDCFSHSSYAPQWCLCTWAPGLPHIEILVSWNKAGQESSQIYLFSLTVTLPSGQAVGTYHAISYQLSSKAKVLQPELWTASYLCAGHRLWPI